MQQGPHFTEHQAQVGLVGVPMNVSRMGLVLMLSYTNMSIGNSRLANGDTFRLRLVPRRSVILPRSVLVKLTPLADDFNKGMKKVLNEWGKFLKVYQPYHTQSSNYLHLLPVPRECQSPLQAQDRLVRPNRRQRRLHRRKPSHRPRVQAHIQGLLQVRP
jgi:hypothetical protein